jgi:MFS family permease
MRVPTNVRLLAWFNFFAEFRLYSPIAILYFSQVTGSYALGMSVYSAATLAQAFFEVPTGVFSDYIGRRKTVICGAIASALSITLYAIGGTYGVLIVGGILEGLARSFYSGNNEALLHDSLAEIGGREAYQEYLGKTASMYQIALGIAAVAGGLIAAISFQVVMWLSVLPMLIALFISLRFVEPKTHTSSTGNIYTHLRTAFRNIIHNPRLRTLSGASVMNFAIGESAWLFRSAFIAGLWPVWAIGFSALVANLGASASFYYAGRLIRRFGEFRLLIIGMSLNEVIDLVCLLFPTVLSPLIMALTSAFYGVKMVAEGGLMQREFTDEQRATMGSLNSFAGSLVFAVFSFFLGALADHIGPVYALAVTTLLSVIPMLLYASALRRAVRPVRQPEPLAE